MVPRGIREARAWTIRQAPMDVFESAEKALLQPLPPERFESPRWKEVPVHPDQFFRV